MRFKIVSAILALSLSMCAFTGCSSSKTDETNETYNFQDAEKIYGDVVYDNDQDFSIPMEYDNRFVTDDMASAVADYFYAVQTQDSELYDSVTIDFYQDYLINEVYAEEEYDKTSFLEALYNGIKNQSGDNFNITQIEIADFDDDEDTSGASDVINLLSDLSSEDYSEKVTNSAQLNLTFTVEADDEEYTKDDQLIYILEIDGKYKIVTA